MPELNKEFNDKFAVKLDELILKSGSTLSRFREQHKNVAKFFAGDFYTNEGENSDEKIILNKIQQGMIILARSLAARTPRAAVETALPDMRPVAFAYERAFNRDLKGMNLEQELQRMILDALPFIGVGKVGICASDEIKVIDDVRVDPGKPFIARVSPDDFFFDTSAANFESCQFMGDQVEIDKEFVLTSGEYGEQEEVKTWIAGASRGTVKSSGLHSLSGDSKSDDRLYETVFMREIYLPREQKIVSMPVGSNKIVRVQEWDGPKSGPYELLVFMEMPDNVIPVSIVNSWYRLGVLINDLMVKCANSANIQKKFTVTKGVSQYLANKIRDAKNGECIPLSAKDAASIQDMVKDISIGGVDANTFTFLQSLIQLFNGMAGNLDLLGGLSPQSSTLGQDQMLNDRASAMEFDMKSRVVGFVKRLLEKYAYFHWTDPFKVMQSHFNMGSFGEAMAELPPEQRDLGFYDMGLEITPYSLEYRSPKAERSEFLEDTQIISQYIPDSGYQLDIPSLIDGIEKRGNIDDLKSLVRQAEQQPQQADANGRVLNYKSNVQHSPVSTEIRRSVSNNNSAAVALSQAMQAAE